jgi:hypothetical protein
LSQRKNILICSIVHHHVTHISCFFTSQFQTCMMIHMNDRTSKYSRNRLRICVQRAAANIIIREIEHLLFLCLLSSFYHRRKRKTNLNLFNPKPIKIGLRGRFILTSPSFWSDLTTTKWRRHLMSPSKNLIHHIIM